MACLVEGRDGGKDTSNFHAKFTSASRYFYVQMDQGMVYFGEGEMANERKVVNRLLTYS